MARKGAAARARLLKFEFESVYFIYRNSYYLFAFILKITSIDQNLCIFYKQKIIYRLIIMTVKKMEILSSLYNRLTGKYLKIYSSHLYYPLTQDL